MAADERAAEEDRLRAKWSNLQEAAGVPASAAKDQVQQRSGLEKLNSVKMCMQCQAQGMVKRQYGHRVMDEMCEAGQHGDSRPCRAAQPRHSCGPRRPAARTAAQPAQWRNFCRACPSIVALVCSPGRLSAACVCRWHVSLACGLSLALQLRHLVLWPHLGLHSTCTCTVALPTCMSLPGLRRRGLHHHAAAHHGGQDREGGGPRRPRHRPREPAAVRGGAALWRQWPARCGARRQREGRVRAV